MKYCRLVYILRCTCIYMLMRDEKEGRKKQARSNKQTRQSNTAHPRQSLFQRKNELPRVGLEPTTLYTLVEDKETPQQLTRKRTDGFTLSFAVFKDFGGCCCSEKTLTHIHVHVQCIMYMYIHVHVHAYLHCVIIYACMILHVGACRHTFMSRTAFSTAAIWG